MEFQVTYLKAMSQRAPKLFRELRKSGQLDAHLKEKTAQAYDMRDDLLKGALKDSQGRPSLSDLHQAEETVLATLVQFPPEKDSPTDRFGNQDEQVPDPTLT